MTLDVGAGASSGLGGGWRLGGSGEGYGLGHGLQVGTKPHAHTGGLSSIGTREGVRGSRGVAAAEAHRRWLPVPLPVRPGLHLGLESSDSSRLLPDGPLPGGLCSPSGGFAPVELPPVSVLAEMDSHSS